MRLRVQVVIEPDGDGADDVQQSPVVHEVATIERGDLSVVLTDEQVRSCLAEQMACPRCSRVRAHKDRKMIVMRTLFGTRTFCPLAAALPERTTPELLYLESKFAALVSYGQSARLLAETLPLGRTLRLSGATANTGNRRTPGK